MTPTFKDDDGSALLATTADCPTFQDYSYEEARSQEAKKGVNLGKKKRFWRDGSEATSSGRTSLITSPSMSSLVDQTLEESFTIQLGAQMKHTHNLRLMAANPFSLCRTKVQVVCSV